MDDDAELAAALALSLESPGAAHASRRQTEDAFTMGQALEAAGELKKALECYERSAALAERLAGESQRVKRMAQGAAIGSIGNVCRALGHCERAEQHLNEAIAICREIADRDGLGWHLGNLANLYFTQSQYARAVELHQEAYDLSRNASNRANEVASLASLGMTRLQMGEHEQAVRLLLQSIDMNRELIERARTRGSEADLLPLQAGAARSHSHLSEALSALGRYDEAIAHSEAGLELIRVVGDPRTECHLLGRVAEALEKLGEHDAAIERARAALSIASHDGDRVGEAENLGRLGGLMLQKDSHAQARSYLERGLQLAEQLGEQGKQLVATISTSLAGVSIDVSDSSEHVSARFDAALRTGEQIGNQALQASAHMQRGRALYEQGDLESALRAFQQAATINKETGENHALAVNYSDIAFAYVRMQQHDEAIRYLKGSLAAFDHVWGSLTTDERRVAFGDTFDDVLHELQHQLLMISTKGRHAGIEALEYAEHARSRALERLLAQQRMDGNAPDAASTDGASAASAPVRRLDITDMIEYAKNRGVTIVVYSVLRPTILGAWVLDASGPKPRLDVKDCTIDPADGSITQLIALTRREIGAEAGPGAEPMSPSASTASATASLQRCYQLLITPLRLTPGQPLLLVPDRDLYDLPFAALQDADGRYLIESHSIRVVPSIGTAIELEERATARARSSEPSALVVGGPNFRDWAKPLAHAKKEAKLVHVIIDTSDAYEDRAMMLIGDAATKEAVVAAIPSCDIIHLATHGEQGGVLLGGQTREAGTLSMAEVQALELRAQLVVLSECDSFRGKLSHSDGVIGIARAFITAGALELVASLWKVDDSATCNLMKAFYEALLSGEDELRNDAAAAMQKAMVSMIRQGKRSVLEWAGFVVYGIGSKLPRLPIDPQVEVELCASDSPRATTTRAAHETEDVEFAVTGPTTVETQVRIFKLQVWAMVEAYVDRFERQLDALRKQGDKEINHTFESLGIDVSELYVSVSVEGCRVEPSQCTIQWNRKLRNSSHDVHVPADFVGDVFRCSVRINVQQDALRDLFEESFCIERVTSSLAAQYPHLLASTAELNRRLAEVMRRQGVPPEAYDLIKRATVRIGLLIRNSGSSWELVDMGSGTIINAGAGAPRNLVLTAAHLLIDPNRVIPLPSSPTPPPAGAPKTQLNPDYREPRWCKKGFPPQIDWLDEASPLIIAVGMYEADDQPSRWLYWAEPVTPLPTLQELVAHPNAPHALTCLLDLAILRIRGQLDMTPSVFQGATSPYLVNVKHGADDAMAGDRTPLPRGVPLGNPEPLQSGVDVVTVFGWFSPTGKETTLHTPQPMNIMNISQGYLISQVRVDAAGSGGATCDHKGQVVAVNSFETSTDGRWKAFLRMVNALRPQHYGVAP